MKYFGAVLLLLNLSPLFAQQGTPYHTNFDDSTLQMNSPLTLMSFNRLVRSAGKVVTYGDPSL